MFRPWVHPAGFVHTRTRARARARARERARTHARTRAHTHTHTRLNPSNSTVPFLSCINKAVIDRRLRPRCCHLGSYFKRPSVGLQLLLLRTAYSQTQGCVCTALQLGGDVEQPWHMSKYDVNHKPEVHTLSLCRQRRNEPRS